MNHFLLVTVTKWTALFLVLQSMVIAAAGWLPTPDMMAFQSRSHIYVHTINRGITAPLTDRPYQTYYGWSASGELAFLSDRNGNTEVYLWDGNDIENISRHTFNDWRPTISRDGRIAFASERDGNMEIYVWEAGNLTNITQHPAYDNHPAWNCDGRRLAFTSRREGTTEVYVWDGTTTTNISRTPYDDLYPAWSCDGRLAFITQREQTRFDVVVWDGTETRTVFPNDNPNMELTWSTDGRLAFNADNDIYVWDEQSGTTRAINHHAQEFDPAWTTDGRLAFVSMRTGSSRIFVWDGQTMRPFPLKQDNAQAPVWMPLPF